MIPSACWKPVQGLVGGQRRRGTAACPSRARWRCRSSRRRRCRSGPRRPCSRSRNGWRARWPRCRARRSRCPSCSARTPRPSCLSAEMIIRWPSVPAAAAVPAGTGTHSPWYSTFPNAQSGWRMSHGAAGVAGLGLEGRLRVLDVRRDAGDVHRRARSSELAGVRVAGGDVPFCAAGDVPEAVGLKARKGRRPARANAGEQGR